MILTLTLNTSMDKKYVVDSFAYDNVNRVILCDNTAGGKGLNVTRIIKTLGEPVLATGIVAGNIGKFIADELTSCNIDHDFYWANGETRACINIINKSDMSQTEFLEPGPTMTNEQVENFIDKFKRLIVNADLVTMSGSAPTGFKKDIYKTLIEIANSFNKKCILDVSGDYLKEGLKAKPFAIKPNQFELGKLFNTNIKTEKEIEFYAKKCFDFGVEVIIVSKGKDGATVFTKNGILNAKPPHIELKNATGSGDSFVGGFAVGIKNNLPLKECLKLGIACGSANALEERTGFIDKNNVEKLLKEIKIY